MYHFMTDATLQFLLLETNLLLIHQAKKKCQQVQDCKFVTMCTAKINNCKKSLITLCTKKDLYKPVFCVSLCHVLPQVFLKWKISVKSVLVSVSN